MNPLAEELKALEAQKAELQQRLRDIDRAIDGIRTAIRLKGKIPPRIDVSTEQPQLYDVLIDILKDGRLHSVPELAKKATDRGVDFGGKAPRRAVNFSLFGIARGGQIERTANGWQWVGPAAQNEKR